MVAFGCYFVDCGFVLPFAGHFYEEFFDGWDHGAHEGDLVVF